MPLVTQAELARQLGIDHKQIQREIKANATFPFEWIEGERQFDVEAVRQWRESNIKQRKTGSASKAAVKSSMADRNDPLIKTMLGGKSRASDLNYAVMQMSGRIAAEAMVNGTFGANHADALKKASQEYRQALAHEQELASTSGNSVPIDLAKEIVGDFAARLVRFGANVTNALVAEVKVWRSDPAFAALAADEQDRKVRGWAEKFLRELMSAEADAVGRLSEPEK